MAAEVHDRINTSNNPLNFIDPWGLSDMNTYQAFQYFYGSKPDPNSNIPPGITIDPALFEIGENVHDMINSIGPEWQTPYPAVNITVALYQIGSWIRDLIINPTEKDPPKKSCP